ELARDEQRQGRGAHPHGVPQGLELVISACRSEAGREARDGFAPRALSLRRRRRSARGMISAWVPLILGLVFGAFFAHLALAAPPESPRLLDDDLAIDLFAFEPEIVTPVAIDVDRRGRVWVIESHTHETPRDYRGPSSDRILVFEDLDRDGRADRRTRFAEGFRHSMSLEVRPDGSVWLATRRALHRLVDTDGDGLADERSV